MTGFIDNIIINILLHEKNENQLNRNIKSEEIIK